MEVGKIAQKKIYRLQNQNGTQTIIAALDVTHGNEGQSSIRPSLNLGSTNIMEFAGMSDVNQLHIASDGSNQGVEVGE